MGNCMQKYMENHKEKQDSWENMHIFHLNEILERYSFNYEQHIRGYERANNIDKIVLKYEIKQDIIKMMNIMVMIDSRFDE